MKKQQYQKQKPKAAPASATAPEPAGGAPVADAAAPGASQPEPAPSTGEEPAPAQDIVAALAAECEGLRDRLLRLQADFENFRKRTQRERGELILRANEDLVSELLPVLDHFELGFHNAESQGVNDSVVEGFRLVFDQMASVLKRFGLEPMDAEGCPFDPHHHEAVTQMPSEVVPAEQVIAQTRRGYRLGDRLLRATQVVVSSGPPASGPAAEGGGES
jgi:molecular chaperone GrpE